MCRCDYHIFIWYRYLALAFKLFVLFLALSSFPLFSIGNLIITCHVAVFFTSAYAYPNQFRFFPLQMWFWLFVVLCAHNIQNSDYQDLSFRLSRINDPIEWIGIFYGLGFVCFYFIFFCCCCWTDTFTAAVLIPSSMKCRINGIFRCQYTYI